jgi:2-polyprenyl-6-methoxyphenol hydroxylase-like FAD-dependent oxidoreductase
MRGSIAIIGGGAAGITLALELKELFEDVLLLESGGTDFEKETPARSRRFRAVAGSALQRMAIRIRYSSSFLRACTSIL